MLLFFGVLDVIFCADLMVPRRAPSTFYAWLDGFSPLWLWGVLWGLAAVLCLRDALRTVDALGFTAAISIKLLWALTYFTAALIGDVSRAWVGGAVFLAFAAAVARMAAWPEPPSWKEGPPWTGPMSGQQQ